MVTMLGYLSWVTCLGSLVVGDLSCVACLGNSETGIAIGIAIGIAGNSEAGATS